MLIVTQNYGGPMSGGKNRTPQMTKRSYLTALSLATALAMIQASAPISFTAERAVAQTRDVRTDLARDRIDLLVGFRPGAAYDLYARLSARYMLRYLPGN